jgi:apolipoprotein N-acyltransferase
MGSEAAEQDEIRPGLSIAGPGYGLWLPIVLSAVAGGTMFAAFPPVDLGALAWVALTVLFFALTQCRKGWWGAAAGLVFGMAFYTPLLAYIARFGAVPMVALALTEALFVALFGYLATSVNRLARPGLRIVATASLWVIFEYLRAHRGPIGLTLGSVYYSQWDELPLLQLASIGGGHLITFFVALVAAALATVAAAWAPVRLFRTDEMGAGYARQAARAMVLVYVALFAGFFWGSWAYRDGERAMAAANEAKGYRVGYVQAAVPMAEHTLQKDISNSVARYFGLTKELPEGTDLIVWPETALPAVIDDRPDLRERMAEVARQRKCWFLAGVNEMASEDRLKNSLLLFDPKGDLVDRYSKVHLVLFGEVVPMRARFEDFWAKFPVRPFDYAPGDGFKVLQAGDIKIGPLICFETLFEQYPRLLCRRGAEVLVFATSDAWAQNTYEVAQHSRTAILRAVEARRYVVRVGTDGESMVVSPFGDKLSVLDIGKPGARQETVFPIDELSTYHRYGDAPLMLLCAAMWLWGMWEGLMKAKASEGMPS